MYLAGPITSFVPFFAWRLLARTAVAAIGRLGSDQMRTGHAAGSLKPTLVTLAV